MTVGWTDGNTFLPVNSCLLASSKDSNVICNAESIKTIMHPTEDQIKLILEVFIGNLPEYLKNSLTRAVMAG